MCCRRQWAGGARRVRHAAARRARDRADLGVRHARRSDGSLAPAGGGDPPAADAVGVGRPSRRARVSRPCGARVAPDAVRCDRSQRRRRTATTRTSTSSSHTPRGCASGAAGTGASTCRRVGRVRAVDGGFELDGDGPFAHVLVATGHPGLARPSEDPRAVHAYEPHEYASRGGDRRRRNGSRDRMVERARRRPEVVSIRRRASRSASAQRSPAAVLQARPRVLPPHRPTRRGALLRDLAAPSYPPGREWDEPLERAMATLMVAGAVGAQQSQEWMEATSRGLPRMPGSGSSG